jgi:hypothetical protein
MSQSSILRHCYNKIFQILKREGETSKLYNLSERIFDGNIKDARTAVFVEVSDLAQILQDKNGEKVFIDEQQFAAPTYIACIFTIEIASVHYENVLETAGHIIRYFKDNNTFETGEYNWHGNIHQKIYIEPIIRDPENNRMMKKYSMPFVSLEYRIEAAINSEIDGTFKRVQSREIRGKPMP